MRLVSKINHIFAVSSLSFLVACGGGTSSSEGGSVSSDVTPPAIVTTVPANSATGVSISAAVTATFSEPLDCATLTTASFTLVGGAPVSGSVACNGAVATFTPASALANSLPYTATITTAVRDVAGNAVATLITWSFTTEAVSSGGATPLSSVAVQVTPSDAVSNNSPSVAMDASGNALAVWYQYASNNWHVFANRYVAGVGWGTPELIETGDGLVDTDRTRPGIAMDSTGHAMVVWTQEDSPGGVMSTWANHYVPGAGWGVAEIIDSFDNALAMGAQVEMDANGNAIAVWMQFDGDKHYGIWASRYIAGTGWGLPQLIDNQTTTYLSHAYWPRIAMDDAGNGIAVWYENDGTNFIMMSNRYTAGAGWGSAVAIEPNTSFVTGIFDVAVNRKDGNARVVWERNNSGQADVWTNTMSAAGSWGSAELFSAKSNFPRVSMNRSGHEMVVWTAQGTTHLDIFAEQYVGGSAGTPVVISTSANMGNVSVSALVLDDSGNASVVWSQFDNTKQSILAGRYSAASRTWGAPVLLESSDTLDVVYAPALCGNAAGKSMAAWVFTSSTLWSNYFVP